MPEHNDPFFTHRVGESSEQSAIHRPAHEQENGATDIRLQNALRMFYAPEHRKYQKALQRVEKRLEEQYNPRSEHSVNAPVYDLGQRNVRQGRFKTMEYKQSSTSGLINTVRRIGLLVAVLVVVGSMAIVLNYLGHRTTTMVGSGTQTTTTAGKRGTPPISANVTPTSAVPGSPVGKTIYSAAIEDGTDGFSWSFDSSRVAFVPNVPTANVQITDATTGGHPISVKLPGTNEFAYMASWSPTTLQLAIATNQHVLIVDGKDGHIIRSYTELSVISGTGTTSSKAVSTNAVGLLQTLSSQMLNLTNQVPASGGTGFHATAWSPDAHLMASVLPASPSWEIHVWDTQSLAPVFKLTAPTSYMIGSVFFWSSDGQYIAANASLTNGQGTTDEVLVWKVSTREVVFHRQFPLLGSSAPIIWQPNSHNLSFITGQSPDNGTLMVWDILANKLVKQFEGVSGYNTSWSWSPDGKALAYASLDGRDTAGKPLGNKVLIIDMRTGKQIYAYEQHNNLILRVQWSPDSKYIMSSQMIEQNKQLRLAKVWVAPATS